MLESLEFRQTISDTFFAGLQAVGASLTSAIVLDWAGDEFGEVSVVDRFVAGELNSDAVQVTPADGGGDGRLKSEYGAVTLRHPVTDAVDDDPDELRLKDHRLSAEFAIEIPEFVADAAFGGVFYVDRGQAFAASRVTEGLSSESLLSSDASNDFPQAAHFELSQPQIANDAAGTSRQVLNDVQIVPPIIGSATRAGESIAEPAEESPFTDRAGADSTAAGSGEISDSASANGATARAKDASGNGAKGCASGLSGTPVGTSVAGARGNGGGRACGQGRQMASLADPLFVIDFNDGLTLFPDVIEYEFPGRPVDLRAQVYGATVQSYSWDTSDAPEATNVAGDDTYRLTFDWDPDPTWQQGELYKTESITVTATMIDNSQQSLALTFRLSNAAGGVGAATWPDVLAPNRPHESQDVIASGSATRPYAVSLESGALNIGHALSAYNSGVPALGLAYSSITAERRPIFVNRYELDPNAAVPNTVSARLQFDGTWGPSKYYDTSSTQFNPGDILQISLQADAGSLATGRYDYTVETKANYSGSSTTTTSSGSVTINNEESSVLGEGWTLDILDRLHVVTGGVILNQGAGNSLWFEEEAGDYITPSGDFSTLVANQDGSFTRTLKDGTTQNFSESGLLTSLLDRNGNTIEFGYDSGNLVSISDANGLDTTFNYTSDCGAGGSPAVVCSITDPANRVTAFTYDSSGRLVSIVDPDGAAWDFSYDTASGRMTAMEDPRDHETSFDYNFAGRVSTITRPDATTESFVALQVQSLCASGDCTNGQPGTPLLAAEAVASYTDPRGFDWDYRLDWNGLGTTTQITDPLGAPDPAGHMTVVHRDSDGLASMFTDRLARNSFFDRDASGNIIVLTHPDLTTQLYEFNSFSEVTESTDELGRVTTYEYDTAGNLTEITQPDPDGLGPLASPVTTMQYDSQGRMTVLTDARDFTTSFAYDTRDRLTEITFPDDDTDPNNNPTISFDYDAAANLTLESTTDPTDATWQFSYDSVGNQIGTDDPLDADPDQAAFDALNRRISSTDPLGHTTDYGYDEVSNRTSVTDPLGHTATFAYDARSRLISVTQPDPDGSGSLEAAVTTFTFDAAGNRTAVTDPLDRTTDYQFDPANRLVSITQPDPDGTGPLENPVTAFGYDNLDRLISLTDPVDNVTSWNYDAIDQVLSEMDPLGKETLYTHDAAGQLTRMVDRKGQRRDFTYDADGRRTHEYWCPANSGSLPVCGEGGEGELTPLRDFAYSYDDANQLIEVSEPDSHYTFDYDAAGRVIETASHSSNMPQIALTNTFDAAGNRLSVSDNVTGASGTIEYTFDAAYHMTSAAMTVSGAFGPNVEFGYDDADRLISLSRSIRVCDTCNPDPRRINTDFAYDNADRLTGITHSFTDGSTSTPLADYSYIYNAASELTRETNGDGTFDYEYDATSQLIAVNGPSATSGPCENNACDETFAYDENGNRTSSSGYGLNQTYTTGTGNRLTSDGIYDYTYDDNGNRLTKSVISGNELTEYTWDFRNRLTELIVCTPGESGACSDGTILQQSDFTYDAFNRRIIMTFDDDGDGPNGAAITKTIYDPAQPLCVATIAAGTTPLQPDGSYGCDAFVANPYIDFDSSGEVTVRFLHGPAVDMIIAGRDANGTVAWYLTDHLGSVRDIADMDGTIIDHMRYSAFGVVTAQTNSTGGGRFGIRAHALDKESGLYHHDTRVYEPTVDRFLGGTLTLVGSLHSDPFSIDGNDPPRNVVFYIRSFVQQRSERDNPNASPAVQAFRPLELFLAPYDPPPSCQSCHPPAPTPPPPPSCFRCHPEEAPRVRPFGDPALPPRSDPGRFRRPPDVGSGKDKPLDLKPRPRPRSDEAIDKLIEDLLKGK